MVQEWKEEREASARDQREISSQLADAMAQLGALVSQFEEAMTSVARALTTQPQHTP